MAYSQSKKLTPIERKLRILKAQLYGREAVIAATPAPAVSPATSTVISPPTQDLRSLKSDLAKTGILASAAICIQLLLYLSINLGFFKF